MNHRSKDLSNFKFGFITIILESNVNFLYIFLWFDQVIFENNFNNVHSCILNCYYTYYRFEVDFKQNSNLFVIKCND